jgi:hypothetical protein
MESETQTPPTTAAKSVVNVSHNVRRLLAVTMAVESLLVIGLTLRNFALATTLTATFFSVTLLAISGVGVWAAYAIWVQDDSWLAASILGQFSIAVLAGYIVLIYLRSPFPQFFRFDHFDRSKPSTLIPLGVTGLACILGIIAIYWVFYLSRNWRGPVTAGMKAIVAFIPLLGFAQFWIQTDYLPRTSLPLVDVTTDLTPTGKTGDIVQLVAKVTIKNRNSVPVHIGATVMRITAYPRATGAPNQLSHAIEFGIGQSRAYRDDPLPIDQHILLYARDLLPAGSVLAAGQSNTFGRVVDFNSRTMRLARLAVDAIFITNPSLAKVYTCPPPPGTRVSQPQMSSDDASFQDEISKVIVDKDGVQFKCREIRLAPRNVIYEMVGGHPSFAVMAILKNPKDQSSEFPTLIMLTGASGNYQLNSRQYQRVTDAYPTMVYSDMAVEYSPSESATPGPK